MGGWMDKRIGWKGSCTDWSVGWLMRWASSIPSQHIPSPHHPAVACVRVRTLVCTRVLRLLTPFLSDLAVALALDPAVCVE